MKMNKQWGILKCQTRKGKTEHLAEKYTIFEFKKIFKILSLKNF